MASRENMLPKLHARDEFYRRWARRSFAEFLLYTKPDYQLSWFHEEPAGELDQFPDNVLQKRSPRLTINCPPQQGKSEQYRAGFRRML